MQIIQSLIEFDHQVFQWINGKATFDFGNWFFPAITDLHKEPVFAGLLVLIFLIILKKAANQRHEILAWSMGLLLSLGLGDLIGSQIIKPLFGRLRPPVQGIETVLRSPHYGGLSFVSNHALNSFCSAVFLSLLFPKFKWAFLGIAFLVAYSRVYVGVHFPTDVLGGALVGALVGWGGHRTTKAFVNSKFFKALKLGAPGPEEDGKLSPNPSTQSNLGPSSSSKLNRESSK